MWLSFFFTAANIRKSHIVGVQQVAFFGFVFTKKSRCCRRLSSWFFLDACYDPSVSGDQLLGFESEGRVRRSSSRLASTDLKILSSYIKTPRMIKYKNNATLERSFSVRTGSNFVKGIFILQHCLRSTTRIARFCIAPNLSITKVSKIDTLNAIMLMKSF